MQECRTIKKYRNRRLYDTERSKYIRLEEVRELVMANEAFRVIDSTSDVDVTCHVLMQLILEEELGDKPMFSLEMMSQMIRFYGGTLQGQLALFLEESFRHVEREREATQAHLGRVFSIMTDWS